MVVSKTDVVIVGVLGVAALAATGYLANVLPCQTLLSSSYKVHQHLLV